MKRDKYKNWDAQDLSAKAEGNWDNIMARLAPDTISSIIGKKNKSIPCPVHEGDGKNFRLMPNFNMTGISYCYSHCSAIGPYTLLMKLNGWSFPETLEAIAGVMGLTMNSTPMVKIKSDEELRKARWAAKKKKEREEERLKSKMNSAWGEALMLNHPDAEPARKYLERRGIDWRNISLKSMRMHPGLKAWNEVNHKYVLVGVFPTILLKVMGSDGPVGLHRHFITEDGHKAPLEKSKMAFGPSLGDSKVQYAPIFDSTSEVAGIAEGLESAASIAGKLGIPVYPCINAYGVGQFDPSVLPQHKVWIVFGDKDKSKEGQRTSKMAKANIEARGLTCHVFLPPMPIEDQKKSIDWNDVVIYRPDYVSSITDDILKLTAS